MLTWVFLVCLFFGFVFVFLGALDFFLTVKEGKQETHQTRYLIGWKTGLTLFNDENRYSSDKPCSRN